MSCHKIRLILIANKVKAKTRITNTKKNKNYIIETKILLIQLKRVIINGTSLFGNIIIKHVN